MYSIHSHRSHSHTYVYTHTYGRRRRESHWKDLWELVVGRSSSSRYVRAEKRRRRKKSCFGTHWVGERSYDNTSTYIRQEDLFIIMFLCFKRRRRRRGVISILITSLKGLLIHHSEIWEEDLCSSDGKKKDSFATWWFVHFGQFIRLRKKGFTERKKKLFPQYLILLLLHTIILYAFILVRTSDKTEKKLRASFLFFLPPSSIQ